VPPWTRIYRIQRDIPMPLVTSGVEHGNIRELVLPIVWWMNSDLPNFLINCAAPLWLTIVTLASLLVSPSVDVHAVCINLIAYLSGPDSSPIYWHVFPFLSLSVLFIVITFHWRTQVLQRMNDLGLPCRDVRTREVGIKQIHEKILPDSIELVRRDYVANGAVLRYFLCRNCSRSIKSFFASLAVSLLIAIIFCNV
jgi:hypothetical protein